MDATTAYNIGSDIAANILASNSSHDIVTNMEDMDSLQEYFAECKENYMSYSPFEFVAHEINEHDDAEELWIAFDNGFDETIEKSIDTIKKECLAVLDAMIEDERESMYDNEHDTFDELLDSANEEVTIGNMTFLPSRVLKECDPIAYHESYLCFLNDYENEAIESLQDIKEKIDAS